MIATIFFRNFQPENRIVYESTKTKTCDLILIVGRILRQKGSELQEGAENRLLHVRV
jgi:hypothetical protein